MLALVDRSPSGDGDGPPAVPAVYRGTEGRSGPVLFTLDVDGERFAIRRVGDGGTAYDWLSGPNQGYGFGSSGTPNRSVQEHRESIRVFLAMIDPNTGYIGDDVEASCGGSLRARSAHPRPAPTSARDPTGRS
jgi:hypothetical protein